jgi:hypothetical protein
MEDLSSAGVYEHAIALIMEAASTSETSVNFYQTTQRYNREDRHFHVHVVTALL